MDHRARPSYRNLALQSHEGRHAVFNWVNSDSLMGRADVYWGSAPLSQNNVRIWEVQCLISKQRERELPALVQIARQSVKISALER